MSVILLPDKWRRQPSGVGTSLDISDYARGVIACYLPSAGYVDIASGKRMQGTASPNFRPGVSGIYTQTTGAAGAFVGCPTYGTIAAGADRTVMSVFAIDAYPPSQLASVVGFSNSIPRDSDAVSSWNVLGVGSTGTVQYAEYDGSTKYASGQTISTGKVVCAIGTAVSGVGIRVAVDGVVGSLTSMGTLAEINSAGLASNFTDIYGPLSARHFAGQIYLMCGWNRALSAPELADISVNPWQIFRKQPRILYFTAPSGGGATTIEAALESISLATFGATVGSARAVAAALESLSLTTSAARVSSDRAITAAVESISLGTYAATVSRDTALAGGLESIALTANAASITLGAAIAAALEAIVLATNPAAVALDAAIAAQLEQITITGLGATVSTSSDVNIGAALESITLSVPQALVSSDRDIAGGLESIQITAHGATVTLGALIQAALEQISVQSLGAGITLNVTLAGGLEQINLTTLAAQIGLGSNVAALVEAITLTEFGATLTMTGEIAAALESIGLTTFVATVVGGESALTTPGLEFTIPVGRMHYAIPIGRIHFTIPRD